MKRSWILTLGLTALLVGLVAIPAFAATGTGTQPAAPRSAAGTAPYCGLGPMGGRAAGIGPLNNQVASILNMSVTDLQAARQSGKSLAEIAADKGISRSDLIASMLKVHQDALAARVADGSLTQAQADQILASMKTRIEQQVDYKGVGPSFGRGGFGRGRGMGQGFGPRWGQTSPASVSNS